MEREIIFSSRAVPFDQLGSFPGTLPSRAIIRELDFKEANDQLFFYYSGKSADVPLPMAGDVKGIIDQVCNPAYTFTPLNPYDNFDPTKPYGSALSLQVPDLSYVILKLKNRQWQFARRGYPITVGTSTDSRFFCFDAFRCTPTNAAGGGYDGRDPGIPFNPPGTPRDGCNVAFFIVDGKGARDNEDDDQYDHGFNIHIDLLFPGTPVHRIPITVDPDVRYPGGSG